MPNHRTIPVTIIGAGLAGLGAAVHLARAGHRVRVLEAGDTAGGCCSTHEQSGFRFNNGALYMAVPSALRAAFARLRSEEHTSELQSRGHLVCRLLLEKKKHSRTRR